MAEVALGQRGRREFKGNRAFRVFRGHRAAKASKEYRAFKEFRVAKATKESKGHLASRALWGQRGDVIGLVGP